MGTTAVVEHVTRATTAVSVPPIRVRKGRATSRYRAATVSSRESAWWKTLLISKILASTALPATWSQHGPLYPTQRCAKQTVPVTPANAAISTRLVKEKNAGTTAVEAVAEHAIAVRAARKGPASSTCATSWVAGRMDAGGTAVFASISPTTPGFRRRRWPNGRLSVLPSACRSPGPSA